MKNSKLVSLILILSLLGVLSVSGCYAKQQYAPEKIDSYVLVTNIDKAREDIEKQGGIVTFIFRNDNALAGKFSSSINSAYIKEIYTEKDLDEPIKTTSSYLAWKKSVAYDNLPATSKLENIKNIEMSYKDYIIEDELPNKEGLASVENLASLPVGAGPTDTSLFMVGDISVSVIFPESNLNSPNTETWDSTRVQQVKDEITIGLNWWAQREPKAHLTFDINYEENVPTDVEPITLPAIGGRDLWINDVMHNLGYWPELYPPTNLVYNYVNNKRSDKGSDWGFVIFVVDSYNDANGMFSDGYAAFVPYIQGPYLVMTYDNAGFTIDEMEAVTAHEVGHIFGAQDEYGCNCNSKSGYLYEENQNCETIPVCVMNQASIMRANLLQGYYTSSIDVYAKNQVGWKDTDLDEILDVEDVSPGINLSTNSPNPFNGSSPSFDGDSWINALISPSPFYGDVSINKISQVEYRIFDDGWSNWISTSPIDGLFNEPMEDYLFSTSPLEWGTYLFEVKAINDRNVETNPANYANEELSIVGCIDNDPAQDQRILGNVNNYDGTTFNSLQDNCINSNTLRQYMCNGYNIIQTDSTCVYGCGNGVCSVKPLIPQKRFKQNI